MSNHSLQETLDHWHELLGPHFRPGFLQRELTVYQFHFPQNAPFFLTVTEESFEFIAGEHLSPTISLSIKSHDLCYKLLTGEADGMAAFLTGDYRADGHIVLSQLLLYLFKDEKKINIYEVQD
ncbi:MAG: hypothetical protein OEZ23_04920 [Gammaproteobacteria bacterium]|nr:hypothetical protein [Gammaproteobacteria bacterium]